MHEELSGDYSLDEARIRSLVGFIDGLVDTGYVDEPSTQGNYIEQRHPLACNANLVRHRYRDGEESYSYGERAILVPDVPESEWSTAYTFGIENGTWYALRHRYKPLTGEREPTKQPLRPVDIEIISRLLELNIYQLPT